jgi:membrane protease YdiL (CAAX protease family)
VVLLWFATLVVVRGWLAIVDGVGLPEVSRAVVPILFMYVPVAACWARGIDSYAYPLYLPRFRDTEAWIESGKLNAVIIGVVTVPFLVCYHYWTTWFMGGNWMAGDWPESIFMLVGYHLFFVAIPEEFFYRGYVQTRLDEAYGTPWTILGVRLGWGWLLTCVIFAFGHSIVQFQWWHFAIIFPSLAFGWLRARTGGILAGALFHAFCNVGVNILDNLYGLVSS